MRSKRFLERMLDPDFFFKAWVSGMAIAVACAVVAIIVIAHFIARAW